jgi:hypothetical protein
MTMRAIEHDFAANSGTGGVFTVSRIACRCPAEPSLRVAAMILLAIGATIVWERLRRGTAILLRLDA